MFVCIYKNIYVYIYIPVCASKQISGFLCADNLLLILAMLRGILTSGQAIMCSSDGSRTHEPHQREITFVILGEGKKTVERNLVSPLRHYINTYMIIYVYIHIYIYRHIYIYIRTNV